VLFDWIAREGGIVLSWWLIASVMGAAVLPLGWRLFPALADRGYTLARALGVLLTAFTFWLLTVLGFTRNTPGTMLLALVVVLGASLAVFAFVRARPEEGFSLRAWWRENRAVVVAAEVLFLVMLIGWSIVRAHQNAIIATEKPMELAFISATMRSETFPPADPWLSGYAISYYYFGYVMAAMFSTLSAIPASMGFNMTVALLFALTGVTVFGTAYNLVRSGAFERLRGFADRARTPDGETHETARIPSRRAALFTGLLGALLVTVVSNYQFPLIELPYQTGAATTAYLAFWDSNERQEARPFGSSDPQQWDYWWWFRAARVLNDRQLNGERTEVIDEFPGFSFLLADVHPHVLALPFAALTLGLAVARLYSRREPGAGEIAVYGAAVGGLIFLNTWDGPVYAAALFAAEGVRRLVRGGSGRVHLRDLTGLLVMAAGVFGVAFVLVIPFLVSFRSQLGGVLPNLVYPTLFRQFFAHFGPLLVLLVPFLLVEVWRAGKRFSARTFAAGALGIVGVFALLSLVFTLIGWLVPDIREGVLRFVEDNGGWAVVLPDIVSKRLTHILTSIVLALAFGVVVARLFPRRRAAADDVITAPDDRYTVTYTLGSGFALALVGIGVLVTLAPEWVYLRDLFGTRMNTVFKLYYQAWLLWGVAAAFGAYTLLADARVRRPAPGVRAAFAALATVAVSLGLLYPIFGVHNRAFIESGRLNDPSRPLTLEGGDRLVPENDRQAALCLAARVGRDADIALASAVGGSYQGEFGAYSTLTGIPTVINWPFHQAQWRGGSFNQVAGGREEDIDALYRDDTFGVGPTIIDRYGIDYIAFGAAERNRYGEAAEVKFRDRFPFVCEFGSTRFYVVSTTAAAALAP
jgi:YYY domain-containing protein